MIGLLMLSSLLATSSLANQQYQQNRRRSIEVVEPVEQSFLSRIVGEETQARVVESVTDWAMDKAKNNPGCVERFVCEMYRQGEQLEGLPWLFMSLTNSAVSFMVAEQFGNAIDINAITRSSRIGRSSGTCHTMDCPVLDGELRNVADYLTGLEEIIGTVVNSVSNSIG